MVKITKGFSAIYFLLFLLISCSDRKCNCDTSSNSHSQKVETIQNIILFNPIDHGSFGITYKLKICDKRNNLIEELDVRGDDAAPKLDSIVNDNIYISYKYPNSNKNKSNIKIPFDNIVVGEGLLKKDDLKFKYFFLGKYVD